ncbi:hypothetical protein SEUCBS139899_010707 [Sporothrix eucalyptigena]|uniref:Protein kinase domain-containing protein n=1 Tax=Sporothrix eucalyptigena TaxID=1812306 RepID=A0ABP0D1J1_9PEZI
MARRRRSNNVPPKNRFNIPYLDRGRPSSPYTSQTRWMIQQHDPLPPFGKGYKIQERRGQVVLNQMRKEQLPQSIYCLNNPPPGPEPAPHAPRLQVEIGEPVRPLLTHGSHIVACRLVNGTIPPVRLSNSPSATLTAPPPVTPDTDMVAKIFDPLYYYHNGDYDIVELAEMEYCRETAAYRHLLREGVDGKLLPAFYGSFTMDVPLDESQREYLADYMGPGHPLLQHPVPVRRVRLILMERVEGTSMTTQLVYGDVNALSDQARLDVIASVLEAYAQLYFHGIAHGDLAPRNVFLWDYTKDGKKFASLPDGGQPPSTRILRFHRFVDLGLAYVLGQPESAFPCQTRDEARPRNPIRLFWHVFDSGAVNMYYWLPKDMRTTDVFQSWMLSKWYGDTRFESVGAVPIPVKNDDAWETGQALTNETWPDVRSDMAGQDRTRQQLRSLFVQRSDGRGPLNALSKAIAIIPGLRAMSLRIGNSHCEGSDSKAGPDQENAGEGPSCMTTTAGLCRTCQSPLGKTTTRSTATQTDTEGSNTAATQTDSDGPNAAAPPATSSLELEPGVYPPGFW